MLLHGRRRSCLGPVGDSLQGPTNHVRMYVTNMEEASQTAAKRPYRSSLRARQAAGTKELIVRAVGVQLANGGIEDLSVARVAERAGVSERTVYRHFPTREALFDGLAAWVRGTVLDLPDPLRAEELPEAIAASFVSFDEHEAMMRGFLATPGGQELRAHVRQKRLRRINDALEAALGDVEPETARYTRAVIANLCSTATWQALRDEAGLTGAEAGQAVALAIRALISTSTDRPNSSQRKGQS
jgi:AcrR family transcriptional regulator